MGLTAFGPYALNLKTNISSYGHSSSVNKSIFPSHPFSAPVSIVWSSKPEHIRKALRSRHLRTVSDLFCQNFHTAALMSVYTLHVLVNMNPNLRTQLSSHWDDRSAVLLMLGILCRFGTLYFTENTMLLKWVALPLE